MSRSVVLFNSLLDHLEKKIVASHIFSDGEKYTRLNTSVASEVSQRKIDFLEDCCAGQLGSSIF